MKFIHNDQIIDHDKAYAHVSDLALLRGYGVFDFFRLVDLQPLFFDDHLERFYNSAAHLRLQCPVAKEDLKALILKIISLNQIQHSGIRMVLTGGESPNGYAIGNPTLFVINEPINPLPADHFTKGIKLISHEYLRDIPEVKTTNYLMGIYKLPEIHARGATDLLYHWNGKISELTRSNFFIVDQNDVIATPGNGILKGINRKHVLQVAKSKYNVEERDVHLDELQNCKEAFITGTTKKVMPVRQVDGVTIGNGSLGKVTADLQKLFEIHIADHLKAN